MDISNVRLASSGEEARIISPIVLGFSTDPVVRWMLRDAGVFLQGFTKMVAVFAEPAIEHESAFYVASERGSAAAAIWYPPGVHADNERTGAVLVEAVPASDLEERLAFFGVVEEALPKDPHWYLPMIAADPSQQGRGHGSTLMTRALQRVDLDGMPAYLESSNPANIPLYQRFGFEVTGELQSGSSPTAWSMWRPAR